MKKNIAKVSLILATVGLVTGCANNKNEVEKSKEEPKMEAVKINNYNYSGEKIELDFAKVPERVVTVYQSPIEIMLALGLEDKVVAASQLDSDVKPEFKEAFSKIKYYDKAPSKEEIMGLKPDLIYSWTSYFGPETLGDVHDWIHRGTNTYMMQNSGAVKPETLQNEYDDILNIGKIFKVEDKAEVIVKEMKNEIRKAKKIVEGKEPIKAIIVEVSKEGMYRVYGKDTVGGDMASQLGAELVGSDKKSIGKEDLIQLNPDVIFSVYYGEQIEREQAVKSIEDDSSLKTLKAVKENRVVPVVLSEVYATGIRTFDGIQTISNGLYPNLKEK
ncbi:iron ABC transporter substrate-binding protein [Vagococcus fessus]|uniref:Iron ABC transporter substrate-binding protein n=1 Tax=Vagococcus fessus TaxID=120370 RepID=A0A430A5L2_9ENTE|nr:iron ABC transporter substrate-binding protein [Vagococcus fessus]